MTLLLPACVHSAASRKNPLTRDMSRTTKTEKGHWAILSKKIVQKEILLHSPAYSNQAPAWDIRHCVDGQCLESAVQRCW